MKKLKTVGTFMISLIIFSSLVSICSVKVVGVSGFTAKDKLPAFLSDVLGLDMTKYSIADERNNTRYLYGGAIETENYAFELVDAKGGLVTVSGQFKNGAPDWIDVSPKDGSLYYATDTPKGSVMSWRNFFERYVVFAQKYDIDTVDPSLALALFDKAPSSLPKSHTSAARVALDDMTLYISQEGFGFGYIMGGDVEVPNKSLGLSLGTSNIVFHDIFCLYDVCDVNIFSEEEFTSFAFDIAQKYCEDYVVYQIGADGVEVAVRPDWSNMRSDVAFYMISGQMYNRPINVDLLKQGSGVSFSADRGALTLYPFWSVVFYFSWPVGNIQGVQVGVWGDTGEVAYCWEYGTLGSGSQDFSGGLSSGQPSSFGNGLTFVIIALIVLFMAIAVMVFIEKKRHRK